MEKSLSKWKAATKTLGTKTNWQTEKEAQRLSTPGKENQQGTGESQRQGRQEDRKSKAKHENYKNKTGNNFSKNPQTTKDWSL